MKIMKPLLNRLLQNLDRKKNMAYLKVNYKELENTANAIENYIKKHRQEMSAIDGTIISLESTYSGTDYNQLTKQWNDMNSKDSTSECMLNALDNYAQNLKYASSKYKEAQKNAVDRASRL